MPGDPWLPDAPAAQSAAPETEPAATETDPAATESATESASAATEAATGPADPAEPVAQQFQPADPAGPATSPRADPPPPGYRPVPAARPSRTRLHATWLAIAVLAAIFAGAGGYAVGTHHNASAAGHSQAANNPDLNLPAGPIGARPCAATETAATPGAQLISDLLPRPTGSTLVPGIGAPRAYSLRDYVRALYSPADFTAVEGQMAARCFRTAVHGEWRTSAGVLVSIWLVQFASPTGAQSYTLGQANTDVSLGDGKGGDATVSGVPDGVILESPSMDKYGDTLTRMFGCIGPVSILIHYFQPAYVPRRATAEQVLQAQASRLARRA